MNQYDADYFENGVQTGRSLYENYHWMPEATLKMAHHVINYLGLRSGMRVLDFGCAKGFLVKALRILGIDAYGCDISQYAIANCDLDVIGYCRLIISDKLIPFEHDFDWILSKDVLEHCTEEFLDKFLIESRRKCLNAFHVIPIGENGRYVIPEYEHDATHVLRNSCAWWITKFQDYGWQVNQFKWALPGVKEVWTNKYPEGNGFFTFNATPRFSLLMPTKNRRMYIQEAINAILAQDYGNWELIVKDAGDSVRDLIPVDPRIHYEHTVNYSFKEQVMSAFEDSRGEIFNLCADDDVMLPNALYLVDKNIKDAMWLYGKIKRNDNINWFGRHWNYNECKRVNQVPLPSAFWKREVIPYVGLPKVEMECYDWDYWLQLGARWNPVFIDAALSNYRCHSDMGSVTRRDQIMQAENLIRNQAASGYYDVCYEAIGG